LLAYAATLAAATAPLWLVRFPPLHDYPGHLARARILRDLGRDPLLAAYYEPASWLLPNVGMDAVLLALLQVFEIEPAGRIFVGIVFALSLGGTVLLHRALHGRDSFWPLLAGFFLFNGILLYGFLTYLLGVGLALCAAALWVRLDARPRARLAAGVGAGLALFLCHLMALGLFGLFVAGWELRRIATSLRAGERPPLAAMAISAAPFVLPLALLLRSATPGAGGLEWPGWWGWKAAVASRGLLSGAPAADWLLAGAAVAGLAALLAFGRLRLAPGAVWPLATLGLGFLAMPYGLFGSGWADARMVPALALFAVAATDASFRSAAVARIVAVALAAVFLARSGLIAVEWRRHDETLSGLATAFAALPREGVLFAVTAAPYPKLAWSGPAERDLWRPPLKHVASLAAAGGLAFVPGTFTHAGYQPIVTAPAYRKAYTLQYPGALRVADGAEAARRFAELTEALPAPRPPVFLLLLYPDRLPDRPALRAVAEGPHFVLYRAD